MLSFINIFFVLTLIMSIYGKPLYKRDIDGTLDETTTAMNENNQGTSFTHDNFHLRHHRNRIRDFRRRIKK